MSGEQQCAYCPVACVASTATSCSVLRCTCGPPWCCPEPSGQPAGALCRLACLLLQPANHNHRCCALPRAGPGQPAGTAGGAGAPGGRDPGRPGALQRCRAHHAPLFSRAGPRQLSGHVGTAASGTPAHTFRASQQLTLPAPCLPLNHRCARCPWCSRRCTTRTSCRSPSSWPGAFAGPARLPLRVACDWGCAVLPWPRIPAS